MVLSCNVVIPDKSYIPMTRHGNIREYKYSRVGWFLLFMTSLVTVLTISSGCLILRRRKLVSNKFPRCGTGPRYKTPLVGQRVFFGQEPGYNNFVDIWPWVVEGDSYKEYILSKILYGKSTLN